MYQIKENEFNDAYEIFKEAFPRSELRDYDKMKSFFDDGILVFKGIKKQDELVCVLLVWELDSCIFLENFAVKKEERGHGFGAMMLEDIRNAYNDKMIVLEVEEPYDDLSERRVGFYKRNHFVLNDFGYMQPALNEEINEIPLFIMSANINLDEEAFMPMKKEIFKTVYQVK